MAQHRLLTAVSNPSAAERLAPAVIALASRLQADVIVAHVSHRRPTDEAEDDPRHRGDETLKLFARTLRDSGAPVERLLLFASDVAKALINTAVERDCTLITVGATGRGRLARWFGADVPAQLVTRSPIPVIVLPAEWTGAF